MTVLIIVILVPIVVFGVTAFITSSVSRHDAQARNMTALFLAQSGIHKAIFNIKATGTPLPVSNIDANNTISVTVVAQCSNVYQLKSIGTSVLSGDSISRTVFAQYDSGANKISLYLENDGAGILPPMCCNETWWPFSEGLGNTTGISPYQGTLTPGSPNPGWITDRLGVAARALRFNQNNPTNYVVVPDPLPAPSKLDLTTAGTVMAWVYVDTQVANASVVHKGGTTTASNAYALILNRRNSSQGRVNFWIYNGPGNGTRYLATGGTDIGTGGSTGWHHIAGTWGSNGLRVYRDGQPDGSNAAVQTARTNNNSLYIGAMGTLASGTEFRGRIDEVYIYGCQKSDAEILAYYNASKP
ncbi:MAG: LamG domain-containing protein [Candidatus Omnitrophica bacterium]|nr:LamG domain-containing protein [Candidatus Omnitrophota bacterium]